MNGHVVVIDNYGHWEAAGTAEFLADAGCNVTVVANHAVGIDFEARTRTLFYRRAAIKNMVLKSATSLVEVGNHRILVAPAFSSNDAIGWAKYIQMPGDEQVIDNVDWAVPVIGWRSRWRRHFRLSMLSVGSQIAEVALCNPVKRCLQCALDAVSVVLPP